MRCEECLAVVEEYFDGELERRQGERVSAHLAACEGCAAALDALAFEQETYLRYDRTLEVTPALWQNVRAGVARLDETEKAAAPPTPLARLRQRLAAAFGAFAPALALVVLAVAVGALWLARRPGPAEEVARQQPTAAHVAERPAPQATTPPDAPVEIRDAAGVEPGRVAPAPAPTAARGHASVSLVNAGSPAPGRPRPAAAVSAPPPAADHLEAAEQEMLLASQPAPAEETDVVLATASARLPTPEEKEMARHLEQARLLLRAFQNEAAGGGDAVQMAYERRLSRRLLADNASLQLEAEASGDRASRQVLDTLEPFLLDIANLRDNASRAEVRSIRERMQKKEIIAALHVY
jgi:hypothetical protein